MQLNARRSDPVTSHMAAASLDFAASHCDRIEQELRAVDGGLGAEQIGLLVGLDAYQVRKRLSELERIGVIEPTGDLRKTSTGRCERVWRAV